MVIKEIDINKLSNRIAELLVAQNIVVDSVILFGSFATGKITKDSDIDLIVVSPNFRGKDIFEKTDMVINVNSKLIDEFDMPMDIIYYSDDEWLNDNGNSVIRNEAKKYGKFIYKKN